MEAILSIVQAIVFMSIFIRCESGESLCSRFSTPHAISVRNEFDARIMLEAIARSCAFEECKRKCFPKEQSTNFRSARSNDEDVDDFLQFMITRHVFTATRVSSTYLMKIGPAFSQLEVSMEDESMRRSRIAPRTSGTVQRAISGPSSWWTKEEPSEKLVSGGELCAALKKRGVQTLSKDASLSEERVALNFAIDITNCEWFSSRTYRATSTRTEAQEGRETKTLLVTVTPADTFDGWHRSTVTGYLGDTVFLQHNSSLRYDIRTGIQPVASLSTKF